MEIYLMANVQTNRYGQQYIGNDDFRGWLRANQEVGRDTTNSGVALLIAGNDGYIDKNHASELGMNADKAQNTVSALYDEWLSGKTGSVSDGSGGSGSSNYNAGLINQQNKLIGILNNQLNNLGGSLNEKNAASKHEYETNLNELAGSYDRNKSNYDSQSVQNVQDRLTSRNNVADNASRGLRGLLRVLGANGAGLSSAAMYNAPDVVMGQANSQLSGVNQEFAKNQRNLDTNWNNYLGDYENDKKKINDYYNSQLRSNEQEVLQQKNDILSQLLSAYGNLAYYGGGTKTNEMNDIENQMTANQNRYAELNKFVKPSYNGITSKYEAPALSTYNTNNQQLTTRLAENNADAAAPTLAMLLGVNKKKEQ